MKINGNNNVCKPYYLGLDIGTDSVGLAVTDTSEKYNILKFKGNLMQSVRLFDAANDSKERRSNRTNRRRLNRKKQRLELLEQLFYTEITKIDPTFFIRMKNSFYQSDDKDEAVSGVKYTLFNDNDFTDYDYGKKYPSVYHLRKELIHSKEPHDIRLVYLAIHHILKKRGHFLFDTSSDADISTEAVIEELRDFIERTYGISVSIDEKVETILSSTELNITNKKNALKPLITFDENTFIDSNAVAECLAGASVELSKIFKSDAYSGLKIKLTDDLDDKYDEIASVIGDDIDLIVCLKRVFDTARLTAVLGKNSYICEAKCELYEKNRNDLKALKLYVKENCPNKYKHIFCKQKKSINNYSAYYGKSTESICTQEEFCKFLKAELKDMANDEKYTYMWREIAEGSFLTKLSSKHNSLIPNQLHRKELVRILENASVYLPFLNAADEYGSVKDKILAVFDFKVPYYVGPLNPNSKTGWIKRSEGKIYPWNFNSIVDINMCAQSFMKNLIGRCEYTGEPVLPKNSLLYSRFALLNELNPLKVNGISVSLNAKNAVISELFIKSRKKVTKKQIHHFLNKEGYINITDVVTGIDDTIKSDLKSFHDFESILKKYKNEEMVEEIIQGILVYGDDKKLLKNWLKKNFELTQDEISYISRLKYKDWGRLSKTFLCNIYSPDTNGEAHSIIDMLQNTNLNLMQLLSSDYMFKANADSYMREHHSCSGTIKERLDDMYISPSTRRAVLQAVKMTDEIVDIMHGAPEKIFIEVARENDPDRGRTLSRKNQLIKLYENCGETNSELYDKLVDTDELKLRGTALYLYYKQMGKCMYTGEDIDLDHLTDNSYYDIDHIYPQSKVLDDSLENKVLVKAIRNREKTDIYPIASDVRKKMTPYWSKLKESGFLTEKKYSRLVRNTPLDEKELSAFVNRQVVETQQSTKAVASLFKEMYGEAGTRIVYSKAGNVTRFRHEFDLVKCREINDLHHAKDAYLNIVVGNILDTKFTEKFFMNITKEKYSLNHIYDYDVPGAWIGPETKTDKPVSIQSVKDNYYKNSVRYTRMPKETKGAISKATIYPKGTGQLPVKRGMDIEKYGGYSDVKGAYFCLVEHTLKKKRIRTFEPVHIYMKEFYEKNPVEYCTEHLRLHDPVIIEKKVFIESLIELDGKRYHITGRSNDSIVAKHSYQFVIDDFSAHYIKEISEYIERCSEKKKVIEHAAFKAGNKNIQINAENNVRLYKVFEDKLGSKSYAEVLKTINKAVCEGRETFSDLNVYEQCIVLLNIMKSFKCDRQNSDLTLIGGSANSGVIKFNKKISDCKSAYLISQSSTGLFEYKKDLLRKI